VGGQEVKRFSDSSSARGYKIKKEENTNLRKRRGDPSPPGGLSPAECFVDTSKEEGYSQLGSEILGRRVR